MPVSAVPFEFFAYRGYEWDEKTHILQSRPGLGPNDYGGFELGLCRAESAMGARLRVASEESGADQFQPEQIRNLQRLLGLAPASSVLILDRESREPGRICIQSGDPQWSKSMYRRVRAGCEEALGKEDPRNETRCATLEQTLKAAAREQSPWERFVETLPVGTGFFVPGAVAGGLVMLGKTLWTRFAAPAPLIVVLPNCESSPDWKRLPGICAGGSDSI
ncbi:hypothetical protein FBR05_03570 [Deltaproteobacteria bacterium PRO3]|nr:hypothetical protein [Deltaproteobacteria bacterium PRO3]